MRPKLWTIIYEPIRGAIRSIVAGHKNVDNSLVVPLARVTRILAGTSNQNNYRVLFNEKLGVMDLIEITGLAALKKKIAAPAWLTVAEGQYAQSAGLHATLFSNNGVLRIEATRQVIRQCKEMLSKGRINDKLSIFMTDESDPHILLGRLDMTLTELLEHGHCDVILWSVINHDIVSEILYRNKRVRINMPQVAGSISFVRTNEYVRYLGTVEDHLTMSHRGNGKHITIFLHEGKILAHSHFAIDSPINTCVGNMNIALLNGDDPNMFVKWATLPALLLRQPEPFEIAAEWPNDMPLHVLYTTHNLDIGVLP